MRYLTITDEKLRVLVSMDLEDGENDIFADGLVVIESDSEPMFSADGEDVYFVPSDKA
jgi:hypothetical protein